MDPFSQPKDRHREWEDREILEEHADHPERFASYTGPDHIREVVDEVMRSPEWEAADAQPDIDP
jgi:DNA-directed RNA polymerase subunit F